MAIKIPELCSSLAEYLEAGSNIDLTHYKTSILELNTNGTIEYPITNVLYDYQKEIDDVKILVQFTKPELERYMYRPNLLAYDLYNGMSDLFFIILFINNMCDRKEFISDKVYIIRPSDMGIINRIINTEKDYLDFNRYEISEKIKNLKNPIK